MAMAAFMPTYKSLESYKVQYVAAALIVIWLFRKLVSPSRRLPPAPPSLPIIGHLHLLGTHPHISFQQLAKKYGPLMSLRLGQRQCIVASSPEIAKELLRTQDANFSSRPGSSAGIHLFYNRKNIGFQEYTPYLHYTKKIFTTEFGGPRRLQTYQHAREEEVAYMLNNIYQKCSQGDVEVKTHLSVMMANTISHMVLKKRYAGDIHESKEKEEEARDFQNMVDETFTLCGVFVPGDFIPSLKWLDLQGCEARMKRLAKRLDAFASKMVFEHRERRKRGPVPEHEQDMLHVMLDMQEAKDGHMMQENSLKTLIMEAFLAGTDTSIVTSEWALTELLCNPWVMAKAQAELDSVVGHDCMVQESDIQRLPYLQAIVKETFRLHPAVPLLVPRESINTCKVFGYDIPAKTRVFVNVWAMGRDPAIWEEPLAFNPNRFLQEKLSQMDVCGLDFELLPFGSGRRMCPAMPLAVTLVHFLVASLVHAFNWSLPDEMNPKDLDMTDSFGLVLPKAIPLRAFAKPRLEHHLYAHKMIEDATQ